MHAKTFVSETHYPPNRAIHRPHHKCQQLRRLLPNHNRQSAYAASWSSQCQHLWPWHITPLLHSRHIEQLQQQRWQQFNKTPNPFNSQYIQHAAKTKSTHQLQWNLPVQKHRCTQVKIMSILSIPLPEADTEDIVLNTMVKVWKL